MPDPVVTTADSELRAHVERVLADHYELDREIGRGGMGIVYRARDRRLKRHVAIKLLPPELAFRSEIRSRFLREAETAAQLSHPNIVPIYAVDERDGLVYFVMACVNGDNLAKRMFETGPLPVDETRRVLREVADALAYAHSRGVVHRDIKPDNILLDPDAGRAMVTDFGIARAITEGQDSRLTATGMAIGTPAFMSPEQSAGEREVDGRSDLYSLGVVGYQMLAGSLPFQAATGAAMLVKQITERPAPLSQRRPDVPADLASVVMTLLEKEPADRIQSAQELMDVLDGSAPPPAPRRPAPTGPAADASLAAPRAFDAAPLTAPVELSTISREEMLRWEAGPVREFRKKLAPFVVVNAVILIAAIFTGTDFIGVSVIWAIFLAFKYAKLISEPEGYDWRDVFKQPRDRLFMDVVSETVDDTKAFWDPKKRAQVRERDRARRRRDLATGAGGMLGPSAISPLGTPTPDVATLAGEFGDSVRQAAAHRDEIVRLMASFPRAEQQLMGEVVPSANALYDKIAALATSASQLGRSTDAGGLATLEREIASLEAQANPLERDASEQRVRRLAQLKRQRRAMADVSRRAEQSRAKLETLGVALANMRYDVLRLRTGTGTTANVTLLAEQAMSLARDVDGVLGAEAALASRPGATLGGSSRR